MTNQAQTTVWLVDDDESVLRSLSRVLRSAGHHVVACGSAEAFLELHEPQAPGCAVIDLQLPGMNGLDLQCELTASADHRLVIFLTGHGDIPASVDAMKAGAVDFLTKPVEAKTFLAAVRLALAQDNEARLAAVERLSVAKRLEKLTSREQEVLDHVVAGRLNKQIAADLGIVEKTVKVHRARVMKKMKVRSLAELVQIVTLHRD